MAEREELILEVEVEDNRAESTLRDIERAAENVEESFEETGTAAERAGRAIVEAAEKAKSEMVQEKAAVDALATALGPELTAKADMTEVIAGFQRMGLSLDDIKAQADTLATSLKQVDDIRLQGLSQGVDITRQRMDGLSSSGNQSRSVLANLAGNSAQDIGQLGGVVGSLGVGIGQLAEYAVDGNIKLNQLASVAGPMLGLVFASQAVSTALAGIKAEAAFRRELVDDFTDAIRDSETAIEAVADKVREAGRLDFSDEGGFLGLGQQTEDLLPVLNRLGLSFDDFMGLVQRASSGGRAEVDAFLASLQQGSTGVFGTFNADADALADGIDQYADATRSATEANRIFEETFPDQSTFGSANQALQDFGDEAEHVRDLWAIVMADFADNQQLDTSIDQWNRLRDILGLSDAAMTEIANQKFDEQLQAEAEAAQEAADAELEHQEALVEVGAALRDVAGDLDTAALRASAVGEAFDQLNRKSELTTSQEVIAFVGSMDALEEALRAAADAGVDLNAVDLVPDSWTEITNMPEELQPVVQALQGFREQIQSEMAQAFEQGGAAEVRTWAEDTEAAIRTSLVNAGVTSEAAVKQVLSALGLLPDQVNMLIALSGQEQALATLALLQGAIDGLPTDVQLQIAAVAATDPLAALEFAIQGFRDVGIAVPVELVALADQLRTDIAAVEDESHETTVDVALGLVGAHRDMDTFTQEKRFATVDAEAATATAATDLLNVAAEPRTALIVAVANNQAAAAALTSLVELERTAVVDVATGNIDMPSPSHLVSLATGGQGRIIVPIVGRWSTRIEGNRPI